jgi:hypothetical protein
MRSVTVPEAPTALAGSVAESARLRRGLQERVFHSHAKIGLARTQVFGQNPATSRLLTRLSSNERATFILTR